jgi:hypothetical protein
MNMELAILHYGSFHGFFCALILTLLVWSMSEIIGRRSINAAVLLALSVFLFFHATDDLAVKYCCKRENDEPIKNLKEKLEKYREH